MTWSTLSPEFRDLAGRCLTERQLEMLKLNAQGWSVRRIALALDVSPSTVQGTLQRARQKLTLAMEAQNGSAAA